MVTSAVIEAFSPERLRVDLTHKIAARLAPARGRSRMKGHLAASTAVDTAASHEHPTDSEVVIDGKHYALPAKPTHLTGRELLEAVHAAAGELVGSARVFIVRDGEPALDKVLASMMEHLPRIVASRRQAPSELNIEALVDLFPGAPARRRNPRCGSMGRMAGSTVRSQSI